MNTTMEHDQLLTLSIRELIDRRAQQTPEATWLRNPHSASNVDFAQLQSMVRRVASFLLDKGYPAGASIGYAMSNSEEAATILLAIMYAGYRATAINLVAGPDTIAYVLEHSSARALIFDAPGNKALTPALALGEHAVDLTPAALCLTHQGPTAELPAVGPDDDALLMYTSGTTGKPKGVRLSHKNLIAGGLNTAQAHQLGANDIALCVLPLYHINGLCVTLMAPLCSGGAVTMPQSFSVSTFWQTIEENHCSWCSVVPTQISYLLHEPQEHFSKPSSLRFARSASAPLSPEVQQSFESRFSVPIIETMGLTETAAQILSNPLPPGHRKIGSPGIAMGNEVLITDKTGTPLPANSEGEICVRGDNVMRGYLDNPEATREALSEDGWLRTGDLGRIDEEGYVYVTGRLKELIIKGGENIAPREIDDALYSHPAVIEAAAFAQPCPSYGQRVEAAVVLSENADIDDEGLRQHCVERVGKFKAPDKIHLLQSLPKGPSGKVQRRKLAEILEIKH